MRISESRIRRIIREEARRALHESAGSMSILPPDVPVDLFVGYFRRVDHESYMLGTRAYTPDNRERLIKNGIDSGLSQQEAEEAADLGIMCMGPGEGFPFGEKGAPRAVVESLGYDPRRARGLIESIRKDLRERVGATAGLSIFFDLHYRHSTGEITYLPRGGVRAEIEALQAVDRTDLENVIELMDSLYDFTERVRSAPKSTRQKLMRMIRPDGSGLMQAVEIASLAL